MPPGRASAGPSGAIGCDTCGLVSTRRRSARIAARAAARTCTRASRTASPRTWALLIAAVMLYVPANIYPVLTVIQLGAGPPSTILGGVEELLAGGM